MTEPYIGQVLPFGFNFAPRGWAQCQGQLMSISQNTTLYSILGTNFGGDGRSSFGLPDLRGSVAIGVGQGAELTNYVVGQSGGEASVTLNTAEMAAHRHSVVATTTVGTLMTASQTQFAMGTAGGGKKGGGYQARIYSSNSAKATTSLAPGSLGMTGQNQPHNNMQPYLAVNFCIALTGIYPPRS